MDLAISLVKNVDLPDLVDNLSSYISTYLLLLSHRSKGFYSCLDFICFVYYFMFSAGAGVLLRFV